MVAMKAILIRAKLTQAEWQKVRKLGIDRAVPVSELVADAIRESLLKGTKP